MLPVLLALAGLASADTLKPTPTVPTSLVVDPSSMASSVGSSASSAPSGDMDACASQCLDKWNSCHTTVGSDVAQCYADYATCVGDPNAKPEKPAKTCKAHSTTSSSPASSAPSASSTINPCDTFCYKDFRTCTGTPGMSYDQCMRTFESCRGRLLPMPTYPASLCAATTTMGTGPTGKPSSNVTIVTLTSTASCPGGCGGATGSQTGGSGSTPTGGAGSSTGSAPAASSSPAVAGAGRFEASVLMLAGAAALLL